MGHSPRWKVYDAENVYQASCKEPEAAAAIVGLYGDGATIRDGHTRVVWREGADGYGAESYDVTAQTVYERSVR